MWYRPLFWTVYCTAIAVVTIEFGVNLSIPLAVPSILGTAISLFLGFRTNSAYQRWWEARKIWGEIINNSRTITRQILLLGNRGGKNQRKVIVQRQIGWCWALANSLRELNYKPELEKHISKEEFQLLSEKSNVTNSLLLHQERDVRALVDDGHIDNFDFRKLDSTLEQLCDSMGKCERIKKTVFPTQYYLFTLVFINMFLALLPLGLTEVIGYSTIPIQVAIGFTFGMIQNISESMQSPFDNKPNDIPMFAICRTIERDLLEMTGEVQLPDEIKANRGILM